MRDDDDFVKPELINTSAKKCGKVWERGVCRVLLRRVNLWSAFCFITKTEEGLLECEALVAGSY